MGDKKGPRTPEAGNEEKLQRRAFVEKGVKIAAGAGILGAAGLVAKPAEAAQPGQATCGPSPSVMEVTFDFHSTGRPDLRALQAQIQQSGEQIAQVTGRVTEKNGWGEWLRDASGDTETMDMRAVSFKHIPFRTGVGK